MAIIDRNLEEGIGYDGVRPSAKRGPVLAHWTLGRLGAWARSVRGPWDSMCDIGWEPSLGRSMVGQMHRHRSFTP